MPRRSLNAVIDNLSTEALRKYLKEMLRKNPELKKEFMSTFGAQSESDVLSDALSRLDKALEDIDGDEYVRVCYEYWDNSSDPLGRLIDHVKDAIKTTCAKFLKQKNYRLLQEFLVQAASKVKDFDLNNIIRSEFEFEPYANEENGPTRQELMDFIKECATSKKVPEDIQAELLPKLDEIRSQTEF